MTAWQNFSSREKMLVGLVLPLVLGAMFYLYLWQPTQIELIRLRTQVPEKNATLAWMKFRLSNSAGGIAAANQTSQNTPLLTIIEKIAIDNKIKNSIQRVQPGKEESVEFWFQEVEADRLFGWVEQLAASGISVQSATITRAAPGQVSARIKVARH